MMMTSDPIADMLTRIRNANTAKHDTVDIPASKIKVAIAGILVDEGFIEKYDIPLHQYLSFPALLNPTPAALLRNRNAS